MVIKRDRYLEKLISKQNNGMIKVITGLRRCGKSFLLFELYRDYLISSGVPENNILCIPLDDVDYEEYCDPHKLHTYIKEQVNDPEQQYYVFIDEAQYAISKEEMKNPDVPIRLYGVLNSLLRKRNVDVYITGSNSKFLSSDIMTEFRGRGDEVHIAPLSFSEYFPASGLNKMDAWKEDLYYGGLPHILAEMGDEAKSNYLEKLNREIYLRDIYERYDMREEAGMESLMKVVASAVGSLTNPQKISATFMINGYKGISIPTISNYLKYLQESFVIQKAERYDIKGRKYIGTPSKYYYSDLGLRNSLLNFRQFEETHLMENVIYNELRSRGYSVDVGVVEKRTTDETGKSVRKQLEIDFVANLGSKRYYIQSAFSMPTEEKSLQEKASLVNVNDSFKKIVIVKDVVNITRDLDGITTMSIYDFLLKENSLEL